MIYVTISIVKVNTMNFILRLILNRFVLSILIIFFFLIDFKFVKLNPLQYYSLNQPQVDASEYYEVELGSAKIYVYIHYSQHHDTVKLIL